MADYSPAGGDALALALAGSYSPAEGDRVALHLGTRPSGKTPLWKPPKGDAVALNFEGDWEPPKGDAVPLGGVIDPGGVGPDPEPQIPKSRSGPDIAIPWGAGELRDKAGKTGWAEKRQVCRSFIMPIRGRKKRERQLHVPWKSLPKKEKILASPWGTLRGLAQEVDAPWLSLSTLDSSRLMGWDERPVKDTGVQVIWRAKLPIHDQNFTFVWNAYGELDRHVIAPWNNPPVKDLLHRTMWGRAYYERICRQEYSPPDGGGINLALDYPLTLVGDKDHVDLHFSKDTYDIRCNQREPSGWRDNYFYQPKDKPEWPVTPRLAVYITMNTASLVRISDGAAIKVFGMEIHGDIDSWCWSFSAQIPKTSLSLVSPVSSPVGVRATINGYSWEIMVESWRESRRFAQRGEYTITGRSLSAALTAPYAPVIAGTNDAERLAIQLAEERLTNTGWTLDWKLVDWLVPPGALSFTGSSALKVIQRLAEAAGGRLHSKRCGKSIIAIPRLRSLPWKWQTETPDLSISNYVVRQLSREFLPGLSYNAVFVSGENQGILARVFRAGTAGDAVAPMVTDALITDVKPARERGRMVIGRSGKWSRERLELPLTEPGVLPGLLKIGSLISMSEGAVSWRGQVSGVAVSAQWQSREGMTVSQNIDVERYRGD